MKLLQVNRCCRLILPVTCCLGSVTALGQLHTGSSFHVVANTLLAVDSLILRPTEDLDLSGRAITVAYTAVPALTPLGAGSIERVYDINPLVNFKGAIGLYYEDAELNANDPTTLHLQYNDGTTFSANSLVTLDNTGHYVSGTTGVGTIAVEKLTAVEGGVVLPLHLLTFNAVADGQKSRLEWVTAAERGVDRFEIERSVNGKDFSFLFQEASKGDKESEQSYKRYDEQPVEGWNYYRLRIVDLDGKSGYSAVEAVHFGNKQALQIAVYPNPTSGILQLQVLTDNSADELCYMADVTGRQVWRQELILEQGKNMFTIDISPLASGVYLFHLGTHYKVKVIKQ